MANHPEASGPHERLAARALRDKEEDHSYDDGEDYSQRTPQTEEDRLAYLKQIGVEEEYDPLAALETKRFLDNMQAPRRADR